MYASTNNFTYPTNLPTTPPQAKKNIRAAAPGGEVGWGDLKKI